MKKYVFVFLYFIFLGINGQTSFPNLVLTTQQEVDAVSSPIIGSLRIQEASPGAITNIDNLIVLEQIRGGIFISNNTLLANVDGLQNVQTVYDIESLHNGITIRDNPSLKNLDGLSNWGTYINWIFISNNTTLESIQGLQNIKNYSFNAIQMEISNNPSLKNLDGLEGTDYYYDGLYIYGNDVLENLDGLQNAYYEPFEFGVFIYDNPSLQNACGIIPILNSFEDIIVGFDIYVEDNGPTTSTYYDIINHCEGCVYEGNLTLQGQEEIYTFDYCQINGNLTITENANDPILDLSNLSSLNSIIGDLIIERNNSLVEIKGLENLVRVDEIFIKDNPELLTIENFSSIDELNGLNIARNDKLNSIPSLYATEVRDFKIHAKSLTELPYLSLFRIKGDFYLDETQISDLNRFNNVQEISNIILRRNSKLENLDALKNTKITPSTIQIQLNPVLQNIDGLQNFNEEVNNLVNCVISGNSTLMNVDALSNIDQIYNKLIIADNINLQNACGAYDLITTPGAVGNQIDIFNNGATSSSIAAILDNCATTNSVQQTNETSDIVVFPTVVSNNKIFIANTNTNVEYTLSDFTGEVVQSGSILSTQEEIPVQEHLDSGMYFLRISEEGDQQTHRIIIE